MTGRVGFSQEVLKISRVGSGRVGSGREVLKSRGSGPLGSRILRISRIGLDRVGSGWIGSGRVGSGQAFFKSYGSGRVKNVASIMDPVRSGQELMKSSRVGSGHVGPTREKRVTRGLVQHDPSFFFCSPATNPNPKVRGSDTTFRISRFLHEGCSFDMIFEH